VKSCGALSGSDTQIHLAVFQQSDNNFTMATFARRQYSCDAFMILMIHIHFVVFQQFDNNLIMAASAGP
jgi:hypothetical protein